MLKFLAILLFVAITLTSFILAVEGYRIQNGYNGLLADSTGNIIASSADDTVCETQKARETLKKSFGNHDQLLATPPEFKNLKKYWK